MKKMLTFLITLILILTASLLSSGAASFAGDIASGFTITETGTIDIIGAKTVTYTHNKTGAKVMHIANDDKERAMRVTFKTPALDNKGIPHVFEHICASGSEKYDSPNLFLSVSSQTYNTSMNASTYDNATSYHYSSMSEAQLLLIADFYMDSVFHPLLYTDKLTFQRESWRYDLASADAPLNVNGIVYNEMKGAMSIERAAYYNMANTLFPGSAAGNNSGGIPRDILTMSYEDCVNFHQTYYHPSNALILLYGDLDAKPFLELIGSYCDKFDRKEVHIEIEDIKPFTKHVTEMFEFPVEISSTVENNSIIYYAFSFGRLSSSEYASFEILASALNQDSSPIKRKLREALPNANTNISFQPSVAGCFLAIYATGVNEHDKDKLKDAVDEAIEEIIKEGFDPKQLEAAIISEEFSVLSMSESSGLGLKITSLMVWLESLSLGYDTWNEWLEAIKNAKENLTSGYFEGMIEKYLSNNPHSVLVTTVPVPGLQEKLDRELRAELDAIKANMSEEEITQIIEVNNSLAVMSETEVPVQLLDRLTAVTVETLPLEIKSYDFEEKSLGGVKAYVAKAITSGLNITAIDYNTASVTLDELHYLNLYSHLLGEVPTKSQDLTALQIQIARCLYKFSVTAGSREFYDFSYKPVFSVQWYGINDSYAESTALIREMLLNTDLTDVATISAVIERLKTSIRKSINNRPTQVIYDRALAARFDRYAYNDYMRGISYYQFLSEAQKLLENDPELFTSRLSVVRDKLKFKEDVVVMFAGNSEGIDAFTKNAGVLLDYLKDDSIQAADLSSVIKPADAEGIIVESSVQYNIAFAAHDDVGLQYSGKLIPIMEILRDAYLTPVVRYTIGAYSCWSQAGRQGTAFVSYRDPSVVQTFSAYEGIASFAANHNLNQEDIDRYIISSFAQYTIPEGELAGVLNAMQREYQGYPVDYRLNILKEIKSVTVNDLTNFSKPSSLIMEKGVRSTAGSQSAILENSDLYKSIIYPFGAPPQQ